MAGGFPRDNDAITQAVLLGEHTAAASDSHIIMICLQSERRGVCQERRRRGSGEEGGREGGT